MTVWERFRAAVSRWFDRGESSGKHLAASGSPVPNDPGASPGVVASSPNPPADQAPAPSSTAPAPTPPDPALAPPPTPPQAEAVLVVAPSYSKASIVLGGMDDPYNKDRTQKSIDNNNRLLSESVGGQAYSIGKLILSQIPAVGPLIGFISQIVDLIGGAVQGMSHGGFDDLPVLSKKRIAIYFWGDTGKQYKIIPPANFTQIKPRRGNDLNQYKSEFRIWLRLYLIAQARKQQYGRIAKTDDEAMLPPEKINELFSIGLWPPPVEPLPLTFQQWRERYPAYVINSWYAYVAPEVDSDLVSFAQTVYDELLTDYREDADKFIAATRGVLLPPDLAALAARTDMIPPLGTAANPLRSIKL